MVLIKRTWGGTSTYVRVWELGFAQHGREEKEWEYLVLVAGEETDEGPRQLALGGGGGRRRERERERTRREGFFLFCSFFLETHASWRERIRRAAVAQSGLVGPRERAPERAFWAVRRSFLLQFPFCYCFFVFLFFYFYSSWFYIYLPHGRVGWWKIVNVFL